MMTERSALPTKELSGASCGGIGVAARKELAEQLAKTCAKH